MATVHVCRRSNGRSRLGVPRALALASPAVALMCACAHQVAPTGGTADEAPPKVVVSVPARGATMVESDAVVSFTFGEWISPEGARECVAMFPPPDEGFSVRVKGRSLQIRPHNALAESTTYHVELTSALRDLRGNSIGTPHQLVFSTGPSLDSAGVTGCVIDPVTRVLQPKVALFRADSQIADTAFFAVPTYLTQTDSGGTFALEHIRPGWYAVIAFVDDNNDNRFSPDREDLYTAAATRVHVTDTGAASLHLFPSICDTTTRRVVRCTPASDRVLHGQWSRRPPARGGVAAPPMTIVSVDSTRDTIGIERYFERHDGMEFVVCLSEPMALRPYQLYSRWQPVMALPDTVTLEDSTRFNGVVLPDTTPPVNTRAVRLSRAGLTPQVRLPWSEPVSVVAPNLALADTIGDTLVLTCDTTCADTTVFALPRRLQPGRTYRALLPLEAVTDLAGLHPVDTSDTPGILIQISTLHPDSFALSLSGGAECLPRNTARRWQFTPVGTGERVVTTDERGQFLFDSIPGSRGMLAYFEDGNGDDRWQAGELIPWVAPEAFVPFYDTVEARARWDIKGVSVDACDPCSRGQLKTAEPTEQPPKPARR